MVVENLASLPAEKLNQFLDSFDEVLCDCDGVVCYLTDPIPGAAKGVSKLRSIGKKVRFVSNNNTATIDMFYNKLEKFRLGSEKDSFVIPIMAMVDYLKEINFKKELFVIGGRAVKHEFKKAGFTIAPDGPHHIEEDPKLVLQEVADNPNVGAVIIDVDINVNYLKLSKAVSYLKRNDVILLIGATDAKLPILQDVMMIGPHYFRKCVEEMSGKEGIEFAKPGKNMANYIKKKFEITDPKRVLFVGDTLEQDMQFGSLNGFQKLLVFSGAIREKHLENWNYPDNYKPDYVVQDMGTFADIIEKCQIKQNL